MHRTITTTPPSTIPAIAPSDKAGGPWACGGLNEVVAGGCDGREKTISFGIGSPGATAMSATLAARICASSVWVSSGLMHPTISLSLHEPGAAQ